MVKEFKGIDTGVKKVYSRLSIIYGIFEKFFEKDLRKALELLKIRRGDVVLDVGFGTGYELVEIARFVGDEGMVYGMDIAPQRVLKAESRVEKANFAERVFLSSGDARKLKFDDEMFDVVYISEVLEIFDAMDIKKIMDEIERVLKPGGKICVVDSVDDYGRVIDFYDWLSKHFPNHTRDLLDIKYILKQAGYQNVKYEERKIFRIFPMGIGVGVSGKVEGLV